MWAVGSADPFLSCGAELRLHREGQVPGDRAVAVVAVTVRIAAVVLAMVIVVGLMAVVVLGGDGDADGAVAVVTAVCQLTLTECSLVPGLLRVLPACLHNGRLQQPCEPLRS